MTEDFLGALAGGLSEQGAALLTAGGKSALTSVYQLIRQRFRSGSDEAEALEAAVQHPGDQEHIDSLSAALARVMADDPAFAERLSTLWRETTRQPAADRGSVVNNFDGEAEKVVQARDISGGITF
ncbi:hypothetical protein [Actinoplanes sp. NPDC049599]|uniref:hypothetical protein n=1 Tax=Actinoplanes sp. NPDC049599 TaxID=3363903 RepID=UPI00378A27D5